MDLIQHQRELLLIFLSGCDWSYYFSNQSVFEMSYNGKTIGELWSEGVFRLGRPILVFSPWFNIWEHTIKVNELDNINILNTCKIFFGTEINVQVHGIMVR